MKQALRNTVALAHSVLKYCINNGCPPATVSDTAGNDNGEITGTNIVFYAGTGTSPSTSEGGVLIPGEQATAQFSVKVE